jgi:hypothetical protein
VALFSESCTRFLVEVAPAHAQAFAARLAGLPGARIGRVSASPQWVVRGVGGGELARVDLDLLRRAHGAGCAG